MCGCIWEEFCSAAVSTRMNGIELYDIQGPVFQGKASPANPERAAGVRRKLIGQGLALPCISTVCDFTDPGFKREFSECLEVAVNLGISCQLNQTSSFNRGRYLINVGAINSLGKKSSYSTIGAHLWVSGTGGEFGYTGTPQRAV